MDYGIGRVPADVDPTSEALAELEAERLQPTPRASDTIAPAGTTTARRSDGTGSCEQCGRGGSYWNGGAGAYLCVRHWDEY